MKGALTTAVRSETQEVLISYELPTVTIGERINPTGRKKLQQELKQGIFDSVRRDAITQVEAGARILDINAGIPQIDEASLLVEMLEVVTEETDVPLCIDTAKLDALEAALGFYKGKALINSVNGEVEKMDAVLPLIKEYGAAVIALTIDDEGIPSSVEKRVSIAGKIIDQATKIGIPIVDVIVDPLAMSMGADHQAGKLVLDSIVAIIKEFGTNITVGCSNISFGIPQRPLVNAAFMAMAVRSGLTCPITNPLDEMAMMSILAADLCMGRDEYAANWIRAYRNRTK